MINEKDKSREERISKIVHCPFEGWADMHNRILSNLNCELAGGSKDQCAIRISLSSLLLPIQWK